MKKKVSIIIPTYNEEKEIKECINSLKNQNFKNFEIIVVDDGSKDNTLKILKNIKGLKILKGEHRGPGFSRNSGAKKAIGNFLVFIDADMTFDKNYLKNLIKPLLKNKSIIGTTHDYEIATNTHNWISRLWGKIRVSKKNAQDVLIFRAIRKKNFIQLGGFDSKYGYADDQTFWYKYKIKPVVAKNTICYHKNPDSLKGTFKQARWIGSSWVERSWIFKIPVIKFIIPPLVFFLIPFEALFKAIKKTNLGIDFIDRFKFYNYKFRGYSFGLSRAIYLNKNYK
jgi:glycosyltransferase involved in cell wall biosynthesis